MHTVEKYFMNKVLPKDIGKIYFTNENHMNFKGKAILRQRYHTYIPTYEYVEEALVLPGVVRNNAPWVHDVIYDSELNPLESSRLTRTHMKPEARKNPLLENPTFLMKNIDYIKGKCIYGGLLDHAFGHFLGETLSRLWIICDTETIPDDINFIFHKRKEDIDMDFLVRSRYIEYFEALGIKRHQIIIVDRPYLCEKLLVPEPGFKLHHAASNEMVKLWDRIRSSMLDSQIANLPRKQKNKKLYISRASVKDPVGNRSLLNEDELEIFLKSKGYEIVHPHELESEKEKILLFASAEVIIGLSGSGLHNAVFMDNNATVIQILNSQFYQGFQMQNTISMINGMPLHSIIVNEPDISAEWEIDMTRLEEILKQIGGQ